MFYKITAVLNVLLTIILIFIFIYISTQNTFLKRIIYIAYFQWKLFFFNKNKVFMNVNRHSIFNTSKGVVVCHDLLNCSEQECWGVITPEGVIDEH